MSESASSVRCFVALDLSDTVRASLTRTEADLALSGAHVSWIPGPNLHLTLAFLGDVVLDAVPAVRTALDGTAAQVPAFQVEVAGVGTFGPRKAPRIVWAGVLHPPAALMALEEGVRRGLEPMGFRFEKRTFVPHITIGRIRSNRGLDALTSRMSFHTSEAFGEVRMERLLLLRSHLDEPRVRYSVLHEAPLKGT